MSTRLLYTSNWDRFFLSHRLVLAEAARRAGYDVHVAVPPGQHTAEILAAGFPVHHFPLSRSGGQPLKEGVSVLALQRLYQRLKPDLVHQVAQKAVVYGSLAVRLQLRARPAVVNALAGMGYTFLATGVRASARRAGMLRAYRLLLSGPRHMLILQNADDVRFFVDNEILPAERIRLIRGSGVDLSAFAARPEPDGPPVVALAARLLWHKGVREFVEAALALKGHWPEVRFVLVGDPDEGNPAAVPGAVLAGWVRDGIVEHWGHRRDMPAVLASTHIVCLPSYREGLPKVVLEALACGRPVVASHEPGCREAVQDGVDGLLVPVANSVALATAIDSLLRDPDRRRRMGAAGRAKVEAEFGVEHVSASTLEVYREVRQ